MNTVMKCSVMGCDNEAIVPLGLCNDHKPPPPSKYLGRAKASRIVKDRKRAVYPGPSNSSPNGVVHVIIDVRCNLLGRLEDAVGNDHANAIVDALDAYLEVEMGDRSPSFLWLKPNPKAELNKLKAERDEAVAYAKKVEQELGASAEEPEEPDASTSAVKEEPNASTGAASGSSWFSVALLRACAWFRKR